jgi:mRNA interferase RelE/StbE
MSFSGSSKKVASFKLQVTRTFEKGLRKLDVQTKRRLDSIIRILQTDPYVGKPLRGDLASKWSLRSGDYRVIYAINMDQKIILLYDVRHRKKVYKP